MDSEIPNKCKTTLIGHQGSVTALIWNSTGEYLLSGAADRTVKLWNPLKPNAIKTFQGHGLDVLTLHVSFDNSQIFSAGADKQVFVWDTASGRPIRKLRAHDNMINSIAVNKEMTVLISGSFDRQVKIWDLKSRSDYPVQSLSEAKDSVTDVKVTDTEIISSSTDGFVRTYDIRFGELTCDKIGKPVTCNTLSRDKKHFLLSTLDSKISLVDRSDGQVLGTYSGHQNSQLKITNSFSYNDSFIYSGSEDGAIYIWGLVEQKLLKKIPGHKSSVLNVISSPSQNCFVSSSADSTIKLWI